MRSRLPALPSLPSLHWMWLPRPIRYLGWYRKPYGIRVYAVGLWFGQVWWAACAVRD